MPEIKGWLGLASCADAGLHPQSPCKKLGAHCFSVIRAEIRWRGGADPWNLLGQLAEPTGHSSRPMRSLSQSKQAEKVERTSDLYVGSCRYAHVQCMCACVHTHTGRGAGWFGNREMKTIHQHSLRVV